MHTYIHTYIHTCITVFTKKNLVNFITTTISGSIPVLTKSLSGRFQTTKQKVLMDSVALKLKNSKLNSRHVRAADKLGLFVCMVYMYVCMCACVVLL